MEVALELCKGFSYSHDTAKVEAWRKAYREVSKAVDSEVEEKEGSMD